MGAIFSRDREMVKPICSDCIRPIVIGVGGATRSGKSTLSRKLMDLLPVNGAGVINQDYFFKVKYVVVKITIRMISITIE